MTGESRSLPPPLVTWAQRQNLIFLTVCLEDCKSPEIKLEPESLYFRGNGGPERKEHEVKMTFFKEIDVDNSKYAVRDRIIEFALIKKETGPYWDRLLKDSVKHHWLRVDFNKWRDEDDDEDEEGSFEGGKGDDLSEMIKTMGLKMDGEETNERPRLDDLDGEDSDDEEDLPDLE